MDELDLRLRSRLRSLADAVPVTGEPVQRVRPTGPMARAAGFAPLLAGVVVVLAAVLGVSFLNRGSTPATTPEAPGASGAPAITAPATVGPPPSASPVPAAGSQLRLDVLVEEACPQAEGGACHYAATLSGPDGRPQEIPVSGAPVAISLGAYRLALEARLGSDIIMNGSPLPGSLDAACEASFTASEGSPPIVARAVFRRGTCVVQVDDGGPPPSPTATRPPADVALPYPEGCPAYALSPRRCAYIVDWALAEAGLTGSPADVQLLGDPDCVGKPAGCMAIRTMAFVVRVRVTPEGGEPSDHPVFCGIGGEASLRCTDTPRIRVSTPINGYHDVPCKGEGGTGTCASPVPTVAPAAAARAVPLEVASLVVPIDHAGDYVVDVGDAILPNGILSEASAILANDTRRDVLIPDGIRLEVVGEDGTPLINAYDHGWRPGTERVHVRFVFTVESFDPGTSVILTSVVVR